MNHAAEETTKPKIEAIVRAAVRSLPSFLGGRPLVGVRVEEVFPPSAAGWLVTLSHLEPGVEKPRSPLFNAIESFMNPPEPERVFHVLEVDASTGDVVSMRLREEPR